MNLKDLKYLWKEDKSFFWWLTILVLDIIFLGFYVSRMLIERGNGYVTGWIMIILCLFLGIGILLLFSFNILLSIMKMTHDNYILVNESKISFLDFYTQMIECYDLLNAMIIIDKKDDFTPEEFEILINSNKILKKILICKEEED